LLFIANQSAVDKTLKMPYLSSGSWCLLSVCLIESCEC